MFDLCVCVCFLFFLLYYVALSDYTSCFSLLHYIASRGTSYFHSLIYHWYHFGHDSIKTGTRIVQAYTLSY